MPASRRPTLAASALLLALAAAPAAAQEPAADSLAPNPLERGARAFSFALPDGGGAEFGYWRMRSDRTSLGLFVLVDASVVRLEVENADGDAEATGGGVRVGLGPAVRRYADTGGDVAPYLHGRALASYAYTTQRYEGTETDEHSAELGVEVGVGVEWFPTRRVSVSGETGIGARLERTRGENPASEMRRWEGRLATFTGALSLNVYLPPRRPAGPPAPPAS